MYDFITENNHECKKSKDINNYIVDAELKYEDHKIILFNNL